jgi:hypothetical protein
MEAANHDIENIGQPPKSIQDYFKEHNDEVKKERKSLKDTGHRSRSKRVRADISEGSTGEKVYQKDLNIIYSTKKPRNQASKNTNASKIETPKRESIGACTNPSTNFSFSSAGTMKFRGNGSSMKKDFMDRQRHSRHSLNEHIELPESIEEQLNEASSLASKDRMHDLTQFRNEELEQTDLIPDMNSKCFFKLKLIEHQRAEVEEYFDHEKGINLEDELNNIINEDGLKKALHDHYYDIKIEPFVHTPTKPELENYKQEKIYRENLMNATYITPPKRRYQLEHKQNAFSNERLIRLSGISSCSSNSC